MIISRSIHIAAYGIISFFFMAEQYSIIYTYIYTHMEYYSAEKEKEVMSFAATWMDLEIIILSEVSQKGQDKYHMISLICGI